MGHSLLFNGSTQFALLPANGYDGLVSGTIEMWFKTAYGAGYQKLFKNNGSYDIGISQDFGGGANVFAEVNGKYNVGNFKSGVSDGNWHSIAIAWNSTTIYAFYDGVLQSTNSSATTQSTTTNAGNFGNAPGNSEYFNGRIDEFRISNVCRYTASYTPATVSFAGDANTLVLLHLDELSGLTGTDASGRGTTLALDATNPPTWSTDVAVADPYIPPTVSSIMGISSLTGAASITL